MLDQCFILELWCCKLSSDFFSHPGPQRFFAAYKLIGDKSCNEEVFESGQPIRDGPSAYRQCYNLRLHQLNRGHTLNFPGSGEFMTLARSDFFEIVHILSPFWLSSLDNLEAVFLPHQALLAWIFRLSSRFFDKFVVCFRSSRNWAHLQPVLQISSQGVLGAGYVNGRPELSQLLLKSSNLAVFSGPLIPSYAARRGTAGRGDLICPGWKRVLWWPHLPG